MAAKPSPIALVDLSRVHGGDDKQTRRVRLVLDQAVVAAKSVQRGLHPKDSVLELAATLLPLVERQRSRSGPTSAPALPPATTLAG